tara:strand:+ start:3727 stop:3849 length:123 start_codon:yes stop_codon:yes gene_type:complete
MQAVGWPNRHTIVGPYNGTPVYGKKYGDVGAMSYKEFELN